MRIGGVEGADASSEGRLGGLRQHALIVDSTIGKPGSKSAGILNWSHPPGSNWRPPDYESSALPTELGWRSLILSHRTCTALTYEGCEQHRLV